MVLSKDKPGEASLKLTTNTWVKLILLLVGCVVTHARIQGGKIDSLTESVNGVKVRIESTEKTFTEFKRDYRESQNRLDERVTSLDTYLRSSGKPANSASAAQ
jgi:hypothetical protein